jgi:hypothetical protein
MNVFSAKACINHRITHYRPVGSERIFLQHSSAGKTYMPAESMMDVPPARYPLRCTVARLIPP